MAITVSVVYPLDGVAGDGNDITAMGVADPITAQVDGNIYTFPVEEANSGDVTLKIDGLTVADVLNGGQEIIPGSFQVGDVITVVYQLSLDRYNVLSNLSPEIELVTQYFAGLMAGYCSSLGGAFVNLEGTITLEPFGSRKDILDTLKSVADDMATKAGDAVTLQQTLFSELMAGYIGGDLENVDRMKDADFRSTIIDLMFSVAGDMVTTIG